jgi:hypothetical protein
MRKNFVFMLMRGQKQLNSIFVNAPGLYCSSKCLIMDTYPQNPGKKEIPSGEQVSMQKVLELEV